MPHVARRNQFTAFLCALLLCVPASSFAASTKKKAKERAPRLTVQSVQDQSIELLVTRRFRGALRKVDRLRERDAFVQVLVEPLTGENSTIVSLGAPGQVPQELVVQLDDLEEGVHYFVRARIVMVRKNGKFKYSRWSNEIVDSILDESSPEEFEAPDPAPQPTVEPLPAGVTECAAGTEEEVLNRVNEYRVAAGLNPLLPDPTLAAAGRSHNIWMILNDILSHEGWFELVWNSGFDGTSFGQNIARFIPGATAVVDAWMTSEGHKNNILKPTYTHLGVSCLKAPDGEPFWNQMFGTAAEN